MAQHSISVKIPKAIEVENSDVVVVVEANGVKLGTLSISRGSIEWLPKGKKAGKHNETSLYWWEFAALMEAQKKSTKKTAKKISTRAAHAKAVQDIAEALR